MPMVSKTMYNLSFLSNIIEQAAVKQFFLIPISLAFCVPNQPAYRAHHSIETALLKVFNGFLPSVDKGAVSTLALFDQYLAFDNIDHQIILRCLSVLLVFCL